MRLANRLSLTMTAVTSVVLLVCFVTVGVLFQRDELRDIDEAVVAQAFATLDLAQAVGPERPLVLDGDELLPPHLKPLRYVAIYRADGSLRAQSKSFGGEAPRSPPAPGAVREFTHRGERLRGIVMSFGQGDRMLYALTRAGLDADMGYLFRIFAILLVGTTVLTHVVARRLGRRLAGDVYAIAATARAGAEGRLDARVGSIDASDETARLAVDLDHMMKQLEELMRSQRAFVAHAAHELRSPLTTLRGELQLALRRERGVEEYKATIEDLLREVELLSKLVEDLLSLARAQRGGQVENATTTIEDAIASALAAAKGEADKRGVELRTLESPAKSTLVRGTRSDLARAIRNLVDNAIAHSERGAEVRLEIEKREQAVHVAIIDEGSGVSSKDAPHIFTAFYRGSVEQGNETPGAGLGLPIAREIARAYGGEVVLEESTGGKGARFVLQVQLT